ncbi:ABC transporter permease, partial [Candidatus Bathyarchaeota archaeon]|nr:ABC transporter permease [Candidatus Bathyarchaeota archaeon]
LGVSLVIFLIMAFTPGDPGSILLGPGVLQVDIDQYNIELGYDRPIIERYFKYIYDAVFRFDFGISYATKLPVFKEVMTRVPISIAVSFNAMVCASLIGIPVGVLSAVKQYSLLDTIPTFLALFLASVPAFWLGMMLMLLFSLKLGWLHTSGVETWKGYLMPMLALGLPYAAMQLRFTRSSMLETIRQDYVRTARAKGAAERTVIWKHAMKNALLPIITIIGVNFGALLGGAIVTETLFGIPGLGSFIVNGIKTKDVPVVMAGTITLAIIFSIIMLIVDLLYAFVDPRIKAKYSGRRD